MLHFCCVVGKNPRHPLGPEALSVGQNRMRAEQQWTGSARIPGEPQVGGRRVARGGDPAVGDEDEPCQPRRRPRLHTNFSLPEMASSAEPAPHLCASIEAIAGRRHAHRRGCRPKDPTFIPPVDTTTDLPPDGSIRPVRNVELQRVVNRG